MDQKDDTDKDHPYRTLAYPNGGKTGNDGCAIVCWVECGWQVLGFAIPAAAVVRGNVFVGVEWRTWAATVSGKRTERPRRLEKIESSNRAAQRNRFGIGTGEILLHNNEHSEKHLPDSNFVKLVCGDWLYLDHGARVALGQFHGRSRRIDLGEGQSTKTGRSSLLGSCSGGWSANLT
jgi:hypothetical protein